MHFRRKLLIEHYIVTVFICKSCVKSDISLYPALTAGNWFALSNSQDKKKRKYDENAEGTFVVVAPARLGHITKFPLVS